MQLKCSSCIPLTFYRYDICLMVVWFQNRGGEYSCWTQKLKWIIQFYFSEHNKWNLSLLPWMQHASSNEREKIKKEEDYCQYLWWWMLPNGRNSVQYENAEFSLGLQNEPNKITQSFILWARPQTASDTHFKLPMG